MANIANQVAIGYVSDLVFSFWVLFDKPEIVSTVLYTVGAHVKSALLKFWLIFVRFGVSGHMWHLIVILD